MKDAPVLPLHVVDASEGPANAPALRERPAIAVLANGETPSRGKFFLALLRMGPTSRGALFI